jgi:hypothetical protein
VKCETGSRSRERERERERDRSRRPQSRGDLIPCNKLARHLAWTRVAIRYVAHRSIEHSRRYLPRSRWPRPSALCTLLRRISGPVRIEYILERGGRSPRAFISHGTADWRSFRDDDGDCIFLRPLAPVLLLLPSTEGATCPFVASRNAVALARSGDPAKGEFPRVDQQSRTQINPR